MDTVVILAGGKSRRMGRDKLALTLGGVSLLESAVTRFSESFDDVYISVADAEKYPQIKTRRIVDIIPGAGPMSGLHAALSSLDGHGVFLTAADLPYSSPEAARRIIELCGEYDACVIKLEDGYLEPLFAYYSRKILPLCETALHTGDYRMANLLRAARTRCVAPGDLVQLWNERLLLNINYPADYEKIINPG